MRQCDAAINEFRLRAEAQPGDARLHFLLSEAYRLKGMSKESERELETGNRLAGNPKVGEAERQAFERNGEKGVEQFGVSEIKSRARTCHPYR